LRVLREHARTIELLLTDVVIPGISGFDLGRHARELRADIRVLYTSGYTDNAHTENGELATSAAFIAKPFTPESLLRKVSDTLHKG
jgi:two-component SAPR family response regulator